MASVLRTAERHLQLRREVGRLRTAPWGDPGAMDRLRGERLRLTVERAARHSPFYRQLFVGEVPQVRSVEDLAALPVTSKADIRDSGLDRALDQGRWRGRTRWGTSGSSGVPYDFAVDRGYVARHEAHRAFVYRRAGVPDGARIVEILGGTRCDTEPERAYSMFRRYVVGSGGPDLAGAVSRIAPHLLYGNRSHLLQVADELDRRGTPLAVPMVCSSSEMLLPDDEERLAGAFGAEVLEVYGSAEASNIAFRLPQASSWTILEPRVWVEILDADRRPVAVGEVGEIVVTTLTEPTSPLIRYATGDLGRVESGDPRGTSGLRLASLEGRSSDSVLDASGRIVSHWAIGSSRIWATGVMPSLVERWQVHQAADRSLQVSLQLAEGADPDRATSEVVERLEGVLEGLRIDVRVVDSVHDASAGKFRAVTSEATTS